MKLRSAELTQLVRLACQETTFSGANLILEIRKITELLMQKLLTENEILTKDINFKPCSHAN